MFRVLMHEAIEMHPHYQKLKYKFHGLKSFAEKPGKIDRKMLRYLVAELDAVFKEFE